MIYATLQALQTRIKREVRLEAGEDLDDLVRDYINGAFLRYAQKNRYDDLFVWDAEIAIIANGDASVALPADLMVLKEDAIFYNDGMPRRIFKLSSLVLPLSEPGPTFRFRTSAGKLWLFPYSDTLTTHKVSLSYWRNPVVLVDGDDVPELSQIHEVIVEEVAAEIEKYHNSDAYVTRKRAAGGKYIDTRGIQSD